MKLILGKIQRGHTGDELIATYPDTPFVRNMILLDLEPNMSKTDGTYLYRNRYNVFGIVLARSFSKYIGHDKTSQLPTPISERACQDIDTELKTLCGKHIDNFSYKACIEETYKNYNIIKKEKI